MRKLLVTTTIILGFLSVTNAQIYLSKLTGAGSDDYEMGYGAFLHFGIFVSDADKLTGEIGANYYQLKVNSSYAIITVPLKIGYLFTIDRSGSGFFVEPQIGYNVYGDLPGYNPTSYVVKETKFNGSIGTINGGYIIDLGNINTRINLGLRYESVFYDGGTIHSWGFFVSLSSYKNKEE